MDYLVSVFIMSFSLIPGKVPQMFPTVVFLYLMPDNFACWWSVAGYRVNWVPYYQLY